MTVNTEHKKALPRFLLIITISLLVGLLFGWAISSVSVQENIQQATLAFLVHASPWILLSVSVVSAGIQIALYRKTKRVYANWREEDDTGLDLMDRTLTVALSVNSAALILSYGLVCVPFSHFELLKFGELLLSLGGLIFAMVVMVIGQQKLIDFTQKLYPEKHGSIYDPKFQKIWYESCDEAERAQIGQASRQAYKATNTACLALWLLLFLGQFLFHYGFLPGITVAVIWLVNSLSYCLGCLKFR